MKKGITLCILMCAVSVFLFAGSVKERKNVSPVTVTDMAGREVTVPAQVNRIASGYYISSSACIALGLEDKVVAVEAQASKRPLYALAAPQLIERSVLGTAKTFNLEACLAAEPDLVILPLRQKETADTLSQLGIASIVVNPENHEQILEMFELIGKVTGKNKEAQKLVKAYADRLKFAEKLTSKTDNRPVVYISGTGSFLRTAPHDMYQASLIRSAGGQNAADNISGSSWVNISYEQLLEMNPDIIVIPTNSNADGTPEYTADNLLGDPQLQDVTAVKNKAVYQMPIGFEAWDSPAPSGILGVFWLLKTIHPELYPESAFSVDVKAFYKEFYGFDAQI